MSLQPEEDSLLADVRVKDHATTLTTSATSLEDKPGPSTTTLQQQMVAASVDTADTCRIRSLAAGQVDRVVTAALPEGMHLSRDARLALHKAATMTVLYIGCLANEARTERQKGKRRSTLTGQDVRDALGAAGMEHLLPLMCTQTKRGRE